MWKLLISNFGGSDMATTKTIRQLRNGQITIPIEFRRKLDLTDDSVLQITLDGEELRLKRLVPTEQDDNRDWLRELYDYFAPVREEILAAGYSEEEVNADIDAALREVRAEYAAKLAHRA